MTVINSLKLQETADKLQMRILIIGVDMAQ